MLDFLNSLTRVWGYHFLPTATRRAIRERAFSQVLSAAHTVPMYQALYGPDTQARSLEALDRLPLLSKQELQENYPDGLTAAHCQPENLYDVTTSGTTNRVMLFHDNAKRDCDRAADLMARWHEGFRKVVGIPPDDCLERCGIDDGKAPLPRLSDILAGGTPGSRHRRHLLREFAARYIWREAVLKAPGVDGTAADEQVLTEYFNTVDQLGAAVLKALPMYLYILAMRTDTQRFKSIRLIKPFGGKTTPHMRRTITKRFDVDFQEQYGSAELGTVAIGCPAHHLHLHDGLFVIEFVRGQKPVAHGAIGELVVTDLCNRACPLIRYATGDIGRFVDSDCGTSGSAFEVFGRLHETIVGNDGTIVRPDEMIDYLLCYPGVAFARLVQRRSDEFVVQCVGDNVDRLALEQDVSDRLSALLGITVSTRVQAVRRIPPEGSGKYKLIESRTSQRFHEGAVAA